MPTLAVVTDSSSGLVPEDAADAGLPAGLQVVPLEVVVDGASLPAGMSVADALGAGRAVSTSRPSPATFLAAYARAVDAGADAVVSVHLSGAMSGTVDAARLAAGEIGVPVHVVDSRQAGLALGFAVLAAVESAAAGVDGPAAGARAAETAAQTDVLFCLDTLEHLRRGGRVSNSRAVMGAMLAVKPILEVRDGQIEPLEKVRTSSKALARLQALVVERAAGRPVQLGVQHLAAAPRAETLVASLREQLAIVGAVRIRELDAALGAHLGPGSVAVALAPAPAPALS
jgi:DegV family protein with EDD domain